MFDRKSHWQNIYKEKAAIDVSWYQKEPTLSLALIQHSGVAKDEPIIDVGGGASVLVDYLLREGFTNLSVLDISEMALSRARARLGNLAERIEWIEADITEFESPQRFSLWHDRAVFHFLTEPSDRDKYVKVLNQSLRAGGHLIIATFAIGGPTQCSGLDIVQYDSAKMLAELGKDFELLEEANEIHITPGNKQQEYVYFRLIKRQQV